MSRRFWHVVRNIISFGVIAELPIGEKEKKEYLTNLSEVLVRREQQRLLFAHFYYSLDIIDTKAGSMMQYISVLSALYVGTLGYVDQTQLGVRPYLASGAILVFGSVLAMLSVVRLHWTSPEHIVDETLQGQRLLTIRNGRTIRYRIGWVLSVISTGLLVYTVAAIVT